MGKIRIVYDSHHCIGAGTCESLGKGVWKVGADGKATLHGATKHGTTYTLERDESEYEQHKKVAASCPAGCIKVTRI